MTRKMDNIPKGFAWCTWGKHLVEVEGFYRRKSGRLSSWCINCSHEDTKRKKEIRTAMYEIMEHSDERAGKGEIQQIKHSHIALGSGVKEYDVEVLGFPSEHLHWLTPLYGMQDRSKLEHKGNDDEAGDNED